MNEITSMRGWKLGYDNEGYVLYSLTSEFAWRGPVTWSTDPPTTKNSCGLYSARARRQLYHELHRAYQPVVHGRIALLGHVVEHQLGFRSAGAIVRSLYLVRLPPFGTQDPDVIARSLAQRYACDVALSPHVKAWRARRRQLQLGEGLWI